MVEIIPAILSTTVGDYHHRFKAVEPFTDWIQVDIVDGKFAPNKTIGPKEVTRFLTSKKLEIQLMVESPKDWVEPFVKMKVARIIVPVETTVEPIPFIDHLRRSNIQVGFSLNPRTEVSKVEHLIHKLDTVLLLSVNPGFQGQHFVHTTIQKIKDLKALRGDIYVEIDGGVQPGIARKCAEAGANALISGAFVLKNDNVQGDTYQEKIKNAISLLKEDVKDY